MERRPLTERSAQGRTQQPRRRMDGSYKRAYGKGGTASSRAVLSDHFLDENEVDKQMSKMSLTQAESPLLSEDDAKPMPPTSVIPVARNSKAVRSVPVNSLPSAVNAGAISYTSPLLAECQTSKDLCDFSTWAERVAGAFKVMKVAEGSYGEVFKLEKRNIPTGIDGTVPQQDPPAHGGCIFKLVPLRTKSSKSNTQTSLDALVHEVKMLKLMDPIPGFARFRDLTVLQGPYPPSFAQAYNDYKADEANESLNPAPAQYPQKQFWAMIEMDDGGKDPEILKTPSAYQIFDIFWLTCCSLSYAEELAEFEHRDLHMGNICIKPTDPNNSTLDIPPTLNASLSHTSLRPSKFGYSGLLTTIIDYTLARATIKDPDPDPVDNNTTTTTTTKSTTESTTIFTSLTHTVPTLFTQTGYTAEQRHQFSTYRLMLSHALAIDSASRLCDPSRSNKKRDKWARFLPRTNVLWLDTLLSTLLRRSRFRILEGSSGVSGEVQREIYRGLRGVVGILQEEGGPGAEVLPSAREVVERARREGWLGEEDLRDVREALE